MCCFARFYNRAKLGKPRRDLAPDTISLAVIGSIKSVEPFASLGERVVSMVLAHLAGPGPEFSIRHRNLFIAGPSASNADIISGRYLKLNIHLAATRGTSAIRVVHAGDFISARIFHSRLKPCVAGTAA